MDSHKQKVTHALVAEVVDETVEVGCVAGHAGDIVWGRLVEHRVERHRERPVGIPEAKVQQGFDGLHGAAAAVTQAGCAHQYRRLASSAAATCLRAAAATDLVAGGLLVGSPRGVVVVGGLG